MSTEITTIIEFAPRVWNGTCMMMDEIIKVSVRMSRGVFQPGNVINSYQFEGKLNRVPPKVVRLLYRNRGSALRFLADFGEFKIRMILKDFTGKVESTGGTIGDNPPEELWLMSQCNG